MYRRMLLAAAAVAASVAFAPAADAAAPVAVQAGTDAPPPLPSLVQTRLTRLEKALERLTEDVDDNDSAHAAKAGKTIRRQLSAAWRGARYYIVHAPPPPAEDARVHRLDQGVLVSTLPPRVRRRLLDDAAPAIADPVTTALGVFSAYHDISSTIIELTDGARVPVLDTMSRTMFFTLDRRNKAIADVQTLAPPAPPEDLASVSGVRRVMDDVAVTFDTGMPGLIPFLDDEIQHIGGLLADAPDLRPGGRRILAKGATQITATEATINTIWPPVVDD